MWNKVKRLTAVVLALGMLVVGTPAVSAQDSTAQADWSISQDYTRIEIGGKVYENTPLLVKVTPNKYAFINMWAEYLANPRMRASYSPEEHQEAVKIALDATLATLAQQAPDVELILLGNQPWQKHPLGQHYRNFLPLKYWEIADDPDVRGFMAEVAREEVTVSYARKASRDDIVVVSQAYQFYRSPAEVKLAGDVLAPEAQELVEIPYREFVAEIGGEWPATWGSGGQPTREVEVVLYLDRADLTIYENRGTPEERSEVRTLDQPAVAIDGRTLIPARAVFEAFGAKVNWYEATQQVQVETPDKKVLLKLGSYTSLVTTKRPEVTAEYLPLQVPAQILNNRTVIPLRFVAEALGYEVEWSDADRRITVRATVLSE